MEPDELDDIDVYAIRAGAELFERPMNGGPKDWIIAEPHRRVYYVTLSQIVEFPAADFQSQLVYNDWERRTVVAAPVGYGVMSLLPDDELKKLKAAMNATKRRR